jgi:hypothetical protein
MKMKNPQSKTQLKKLRAKSAKAQTQFSKDLPKVPQKVKVLTGFRQLNRLNVKARRV